MEDFSPKQEQKQETPESIVKKTKKTSEFLHTKIIPPPRRSYIEMTQQKESDEPFRGIED